MIFIGIDPGLYGAIAVISDKFPPTRPEFYDTPINEIKSGKKIRRQMDAAALRGIIEHVLEKYQTAATAVIEKVQPMPSQQDESDPNAPRRSMGAASAFNFGKGVGIWIGLLAGMEIPYQEVHPARWKKVMLADMGKGKDASRVKAVQMFPYSANDLKLKKHHGRADALLLAVYGKRMHGLPQEKEQLLETSLF